MPHRPFQFSLRVVFAVVAFVSSALALWVSPPTWYTGLIELLFVVVLPAFALVCAVHFTARARAGCIGFAVATALPAVSHILEFIQTSRIVVSENGRAVRIEPDFVWGLEGSAGWFSDVLLLWGLAPVVAGACVALHAFLLSTDAKRTEREDRDHDLPSTTDFAKANAAQRCDCEASG